MSNVIQVPPTRRMELAWCAALACGVYLSWRHFRLAERLAGVDRDQVELHQRYAVMRGYQRLAMWAGERGIRAEQRYQQKLNEMR